MQCQDNINKATTRITAVTKSVPKPSAQLLIWSMALAISTEPKIPTKAPRLSQRVRLSRPLVDAAMMPINRAASSVSLNTMIPVPSM